MPVIISTAQTRHKDSYAAASDIGIALRANGEEKVKIIDSNLNVLSAGLPAPVAAATVADGGAGNLLATKWYAWQYVYAATARYPFVISTVSGGGGQLSPRSNPGPVQTHQIGGSNQEVDVTCAYSTRADISEIWVYRTTAFDTQLEAQTAADAGQIYYVSLAANNTAGGSVVIVDNESAPTEQIELDNFEAATFAFCVYDGSYFWGFGNYTFTAAASWDNSHTGSTGKITLTGSDTWFDGRNGMNVRLAGITTGGYDGQGTFRFKWLTATTATVYTTTSASPVALPSTGSGQVTIQGPATTLYRSKLNNPFGWGYTQAIADVQFPIEFGERLGGGYGTSISTVPNQELLVLCTRYPSKTYSLNLRAAAEDSFFSTKRLISDVYAFTNQASVFAARQGATNVLRGMDYENGEIVQCDGIRMWPVMQEIGPTLRDLTSTRSRQELAHGVYDPRTQTNCMWVTTADSVMLVDLGIFEDTKSGAITLREDHDLLCSATLSDTTANTKVTGAGTQAGIYGTAMVPGVFSDWLNKLTGLTTGTVASATATTLVRSGATNFDTANDGMIGNWVLVTDSAGENEQWARISAVSASTLTIDLCVGGGNETQFDPVPVQGALFYIGLIECSISKYFDAQKPSTSKNVIEQWLNMRNAGGTYVRYYRDRDETGYIKSISPTRVTYLSTPTAGTDTWFVKKEIPAEQSRAFGVKIINRNYEQWRFFNTVLKIVANP